MSDYHPQKDNNLFTSYLSAINKKSLFSGAEDLNRTHHPRE